MGSPVLDLAAGHGDGVRWQVAWRIDKFRASIDAFRERYGKAEGERFFHLLNTPVETINGVGNLLTTNGANALWTKLIGGAGTVFDNTNAYIGVGDSNTAEAVGQTDLQASTNKLRKVMDATYPTVSTNTVTFKATFATSDANYAWNEWAVFNASANGTMLNRKVASLGTKTSAASWALTVTITLT